MIKYFILLKMSMGFQVLLRSLASTFFTFAVVLFFTQLSLDLGVQSRDFRIGTATRVINPKIGSWIQGAGVPVQATEIRDDLEANGIYLTNGDTQLLLVSCDLVGMESDYATQLREAMAIASGIPPRNILISCTHTHGGPSLVKTNYLMPLDTAYLEKLTGWMVDLSFAPLLNDPGQDWKESIFYKLVDAETILTNTHAYTEWIDSKTGETKARMLYDHRIDPEENENLTEMPENNKLVKGLQEKLYRHIQARDQLPLPGGNN